MFCKTRSTKFTKLCFIFVLIICLSFISSCAHYQQTTLSSQPSKNNIDQNESFQNDNKYTNHLLNPPSSYNKVFNSMYIFKDGLIHSEQNNIQQFTTNTQYELNFIINEPYQSIIGEEKITYWNNEKETLYDFYLRLFSNVSGENLSISKIFIDDIEIEFNVINNNTTVEINLPEPLQIGESICLRIMYSVQIPQSLSGNYGQLSYTDNILSLDQIYAIVPVYNQNGWNIQTPSINGDMIYSDPSFYKVNIQSPSSLLIATSGFVLEEEEKNGIISRLIVAGPVRDFYIAASSDFVSISEQVGETLVTSYFPPEFSEAGKLTLETAVRVLQAFNDIIGPYPYTKLNVVSVPLVAHGMEYSGIVAINLKYYDKESTYAGKPAFVTLQYFIIHEITHQWFFNCMMSDQINEPWIDEGFAQYMTYAFYNYENEPTNANYVKDTWKERWNRIGKNPIPIGLAVNEYNRTEYIAIIYGRAPLFIDQLSKKMGASNFSELLRTLYVTYKWNFLSTEDLLKLANDICSCNLGDDFNSWVY